MALGENGCSGGEQLFWGRTAVLGVEQLFQGRTVALGRLSVLGQNSCSGVEWVFWGRMAVMGFAESLFPGKQKMTWKPLINKTNIFILCWN